MEVQMKIDEVIKIPWWTVASKIGVTRGKEKLLREIPIETEFFVASYITIRITSYRVYRNFEGGATQDEAGSSYQRN